MKKWFEVYQTEEAEFRPVVTEESFRRMPLVVSVEAENVDDVFEMGNHPLRREELHEYMSPSQKRHGMRSISVGDVIREVSGTQRYDKELDRYVTNDIDWVVERIGWGQLPNRDIY